MGIMKSSFPGLFVIIQMKINTNLKHKRAIETWANVMMLDSLSTADAVCIDTLQRPLFLHKKTVD